MRVGKDRARLHAQPLHARTYHSSLPPQALVTIASQPGRKASTSPARTQQQQTCQSSRPNACLRQCPFERQRALIRDISARTYVPLIAPTSGSGDDSFSAGSIAVETSCGDTTADKQDTKASVDTGVDMVGGKVGAERHRSAANGGELQVDPPYFSHDGCSDAVQMAHRVAHRQQRAPRAAGGSTMHTRTTVLAALPQPRHAASAMADVVASHAGLCGPVLPIKCVRTHASTISTGSLAVFCAFTTLSEPGAAARPPACSPGVACLAAT
eukprot:COSAG02_NODE_7480_length_2993_cov_40.034900_2_plen_269_part_00